MAKKMVLVVWQENGKVIVNQRIGGKWSTMQTVKLDNAEDAKNYAEEKTKLIKQRNPEANVKMKKYLK